MQTLYKNAYMSDTYQPEITDEVECQVIRCMKAVELRLSEGRGGMENGVAETKRLNGLPSNQVTNAIMDNLMDNNNT